MHHEEIVRLYAAGHSAGEIGEQLRLTKNAAAGAIDRHQRRHGKIARQQSLKQIQQRAARKREGTWHEDTPARRPAIVRQASRELTKSELREMLAQAVRNTGGTAAG